MQKLFTQVRVSGLSNSRSQPHHWQYVTAVTVQALPIFCQGFTLLASHSTNVTVHTKAILWRELNKSRSRKTSCKLNNSVPGFQSCAVWKQNRLCHMAVAPQNITTPQMVLLISPQGNTVLDNLRHTESVFKLKELKSTQLNIPQKSHIPTVVRIVFWI